MDRVGEVDRRGAARQGQDLAARGEDIDRVGIEVDLHMLQELGRIVGLVLDVHQRLQPQRAQPLRIDGAVAALVVDFVEPVRGNPGLGHRVHGLGTQLELDRRSQRAHQRGVQRLVAVELRDRDVILEPARYRLVHLVQHAEAEVALELGLNDDAKAEDVADLREVGVLVAHLAVDRIDGLFAAADLHLQPGLRAGVFEIALHALDDVAPVAARALHRLGQCGAAGVEFALQVRDHAGIDEGARRQHHRLHLGQLEARVLETPDRLAEGLALLHIGERVGQRALHRADAADGDDQPLLRQLLHQLHEALALALAEQVLGRHRHLVEEQLRGVLRLHADLVEVAAAAEARRGVTSPSGSVGLDEQQRHPLGAIGAAGLAHHRDQVGVLTVGDEGL